MYRKNTRVWIHISNTVYSPVLHSNIAFKALSNVLSPWQEVTMQCEAQHPVREEVSQDALCGRRTGCEVWQQSNDGVLWRVLASIPGMCL